MLKPVTLADINIDTAGTAEQVVAATTRITSVIFQADADNTGSVYIGDSNVAAARGIELEPGNSITIVADSSGRFQEELDLSDFWCDTETNNNDLKVTYFTRK
jgi:hypothetical protein